MNAPTPPRNDDELTPEERELAALYRQLPQAEPDRALDDAILAQATRAVHGARSPRRRGPPRWVFGAGTAAVLVLAAGLAWRLHQPGLPTPGGQHAVTPMTSATTSTAQPPPAFAPRMAPLAAPPAPPPPQARASPQASRGAARATIMRSNALPAPPPTPPSPPPPPKVLAQPQPSPAVHEQAAPRIAPPPDPPAPPPPVQEISTNAVAPPHPRRKAQAAAAGTADLPASARSNATLAGIQHIRDLLHAGHRSKAVAALRTFRHAHPDYPLPADLKALLGDGH